MAYGKSPKAMLSKKMDDMMGKGAIMGKPGMKKMYGKRKMKK